jgi:2-keto-4-pentenoate hydratase/2-oxohepta-3-ene-1,7-dioic acid hydratase in catechol pathway
MRFLSYTSSNGLGIGVLSSNHDAFFQPLPGLDMLTVIGKGSEGLASVASAAANVSALPLSSVKIVAPIPQPRRNVFCLGWNYAEHSTETAHIRAREAKPPERPVFFTKATTTVNGPYGDLLIDAQVSTQIDWEVELGVVLGVGGKNISRVHAMDHVFGYTVINDISARDVQIVHGKQFFKGKSLDGYCPMGPWIVTRDEIADPHDLDLRCRVNGVLKQEGYTRDMIFDIPAIIEWLSRGMTLLPGDIIATGTPAGVGFVRTPPEFLRPGDVVESEVDQIGVIRNRVVAAGLSTEG